MKNQNTRQRGIFLLLFMGVAWHAQAQFPSFNATYNRTFPQASLELVSKPELEAFGLSEQDTSFQVDVTAAHYFASYFDRRAILVQEQLDSLKSRMEALSSKGQEEDWDSLIYFNNKMVRLKDQRDSLRAKKWHFQSINTYFGSPKLAARFFPVKNRQQGEFFYSNVSSRGVSALTSFVIQGNDSRRVATTDVISAMIGATKVGFTTVFYSGSEEDTLESNARVFSGGGLTNLRFEFPIYFQNRRNFLIYSSFKPGFIADLPVFEGDINKGSFRGYYELPIELLLEVRTNSGEFSLFANWKVARVAGTKAFYETIVLQKNEQPLDTSFWISQVYAGLSISENFKISVSIPLSASAGVELPDRFQVGIQLIPSKNN